MATIYEIWRRQGRVAFRAGKGEDANPYSTFEFTKWQSWLDGYQMEALRAAPATEENTDAR